MDNWDTITSPEVKKQKLRAYIKRINNSITSADGYITAEKNLLMFKKFQDTFLTLGKDEVQMKDGEIVSISGVEVLANNLLLINGTRNPKLNIKSENKMDSYYSLKSFATY